jgi:hypothetical protein
LVLGEGQGAQSEPLVLPNSCKEGEKGGGSGSTLLTSGPASVRLGPQGQVAHSQPLVSSQSDKDRANGGRAESGSKHKFLVLHQPDNRVKEGEGGDHLPLVVPTSAI